MTAYIVVEVEVKDPKRYADYKTMVPASLESFGGKFLVRGGAVEKLEGNWEPSRFVVIEFDSVEQAKRWWDSDEYREARNLRQATADTKMIVVEGVSP
ncbi:MAG: DUF1330 domain-containing protein [Lysobacterales bacterium]|nr:MAG: DUF1330 domain-containing protein [Xanthomonadales bacterium]